MRVREHITSDVLIDYVENRLDAGHVARVRDHLATGCQLCAHELSFWSRMLPRLQAEHSTPTPPHVLQRAFALFDTLERKPALMERILAVLVFDSRQQFIPVGARDQQNASFKLLFEAKDAHIDLLCERDNERWAIAGQVLTEKNPELGWKIALHGDDLDLQIDADMYGEFQIADVKPGHYDLILQDGYREIALTSLHL